MTGMKKLLLITAVAPLAASCTFVRPYPDDLGYEKMLDVDGSVSGGQTITLHVSPCIPLTSDSNLKSSTINDPELRCAVLVNGEAVEVKSGSRSFVTDEAVNHGDHVSIKVEADGFPTAKCELTVPETPVVEESTLAVDGDGFISCEMRLSRKDRTEYFLFSLMERKVVTDHLDGVLVDQTVESRLSYGMFIKNFQGQHIDPSGGSYGRGVYKFSDKLLEKPVLLSSEVPAKQPNSYRRKDENGAIHQMREEWQYQVSVLAYSEASYITQILYRTGGADGGAASLTGFKPSKHYTNVEGGSGVVASESSPAYSDWETIDNL